MIRCLLRRDDSGSIHRIWCHFVLERGTVWIFLFWLITTKMQGAFFQNLICWIIRNLVVWHQLVASTCGVRVVPCTGRNLAGSTFGILWCSFLWASWCGITSMARGAVIIDVDSSLIKWEKHSKLANCVFLINSFMLTFCSSLIDHSENGPFARLVAAVKSLRCWVL